MQPQNNHALFVSELAARSFLPHYVDFDGDDVTTVFQGNPPRHIFQTNQRRFCAPCNLDKSCVKVSDMEAVADVITACSGSKKPSWCDLMDASRVCLELPPYALEFYHRLLRKWQARNNSVVRTSIPKLYELCMLSIGRVTKTSRVIPRRHPRPTLNHIIQRVLRRMLDRCNEAAVYETWPMMEFAQYPGSSECRNELELWLNRTCYLKQQRCPIERVKDCIRATPQFAAPIDHLEFGLHQVRVHQHNYFRCKCPPPPVRTPERLPVRKPKTPKVSKALRAAQRAERRAKRR